MIFVLFLLAGVLTGLRTFTPLAVSTFFLRHNRLHLAGTPLAFLSSVAAHVVLVAAALGEIVVDKMPWCPPRTALPGLLGRISMGALTGAVLASSSGSVAWWLGAAVAAIGAVIGCYGGWYARARAVAALRCPDWMVAVAEDLVCILGSLVMAHAA